ncbi:MAG: hypothetical protein HY720_27790 [Planctomycetes bacterium]|nr:hypothetical protein [Planctomycetota bacterium]
MTMTLLAHGAAWSQRVTVQFLDPGQQELTAVEVSRWQGAFESVDRPDPPLLPGFPSSNDAQFTLRVTFVPPLDPEPDSITVSLETWRVALKVDQIDGIVLARTEPGIYEALAALGKVVGAELRNWIIVAGDVDDAQAAGDGADGGPDDRTINGRVYDNLHVLFESRSIGSVPVCDREGKERIRVKTRVTIVRVAEPYVDEGIAVGKRLVGFGNGRWDACDRNGDGRFDASEREPLPFRVPPAPGVDPPIADDGSPRIVQPPVTTAAQVLQDLEQANRQLAQACVVLVDPDLAEFPPSSNKGLDELEAHLLEQRTGPTPCPGGVRVAWPRIHLFYGIRIVETPGSEGPHRPDGEGDTNENGVQDTYVDLMDAGKKGGGAYDDDFLAGTVTDETRNLIDSLGDRDLSTLDIIVVNKIYRPQDRGQDKPMPGIPGGSYPITDFPVAGRSVLANSIVVAHDAHATSFRTWAHEGVHVLRDSPGHLGQFMTPPDFTNLMNAPEENGPIHEQDAVSGPKRLNDRQVEGVRTEGTTAMLRNLDR